MRKFTFTQAGITADKLLPGDLVKDILRGDFWLVIGIKNHRNTKGELVRILCSMLTSQGIVKTHCYALIFRIGDTVAHGFQFITVFMRPDDLRRS